MFLQKLLRYSKPAEYQIFRTEHWVFHYYITCKKKTFGAEFLQRYTEFMYWNTFLNP